MPKETVQYPSTSTFSGSETSVHWNKAGDMPGYVQLHIERHYWSATLDPTKREHLTDCACASSDQICASLPKSCSCTGNMACSNCPTPDNTAGEAAGNEALVSDPLTREQINKLIRTLRRARDQAFGADE